MHNTKSANSQTQHNQIPQVTNPHTNQPKLPELIHTQQPNSKQNQIKSNSTTQASNKQIRNNNVRHINPAPETHKQTKTPHVQTQKQHPNSNTNNYKTPNKNQSKAQNPTDTENQNKQEEMISVVLYCKNQTTQTTKSTKHVTSNPKRPNIELQSTKSAKPTQTHKYQNHKIFKTSKINVNQPTPK